MHQEYNRAAYRPLPLFCPINSLKLRYPGDYPPLVVNVNVEDLLSYTSQTFNTILPIPHFPVFPRSIRTRTETAYHVHRHVDELDPQSRPPTHSHVHQREAQWDAGTKREDVRKQGVARALVVLPVTLHTSDLEEIDIS